MKNIFISSLVVIASFGIGTTAHAFSFYDEIDNGDLSGERLTPTPLGSLSLGTNTLKAAFNQGLTPDRDYFTFTIPQGQVLTEIILKSWTTSPITFEDIAFIGIVEGPTFNFEFGGASQLNQERPAEGLFGWSHLRSTQVDTNKVLTEMALSNLPPDQSGFADAVNAEADSNPYDFITDEAIRGQLEQNLRNLGRTGAAGTGNAAWYPGAKGFDIPLGPGDYSIWLRQGTSTQMRVQLDFNTAKVPEPNSVVGIVITLGLVGLSSRQKKA